MRIVSTKAHGVLDYLTGAALLAAPGLLGPEDAPTAARPQAGRRRGDHLQSADPLRTRTRQRCCRCPYTSPWLFGFAGRGARYRLPHALVGTQEILAAATTKTR